jgi:pimeloyl-ACP methyl ester carboxylesterase
VHLVGLSYGGTLAAMVTAKEPQLIRPLTLAEPGISSLLVESPDGLAALEEWTKGTEPMIAAIKAGDSVKAIRHLSALVTGDSPEDFDKLPAGLRRCVAGSKPVVIPKASHPMSYDNPAEFNRVVMAFVAQHAAGPARRP